MKVIVGNRKRVFLLAAALLVLLGAAGVYYFVIRKDGDSTQQQEPADDYQPSELSVPTDYYAPRVDEIKASYLDPSDQYAQMINYAYSKELVKKYDESIALYEAAIEVAPDETMKKDAQYAVYWLATTIDRKDLADKYAGILGEEYLQKKAQQNVGRDE